MRPYPGLNADEEERVYNYRHSRGRRVIENAFSILASRWTIFHKPIRAMVSNVEKYTLACLTLHNYLRQTENAFYPPSGFIDSENDCRIIIPGSWRSDIDGNRLGGALQNLRSVRGSGYCVDAISQRDYLKKYVNSEGGSVPWNWIILEEHQATTEMNEYHLD